MPDQGGRWGDVDEVLYWLPRACGKYEDNTIFARAGEVSSIRRKGDGRNRS